MKRRRARKPERRSFKLPTWQSLGRRGQIIIGAIGILFVIGLAAMFTGTQLENHNSFCVSCHTEGEQTFYNQSLAAAPVDLASFHEIKDTTACIDCHTGAGPVGRFFGLMAGASDLVSYFSGNYPKPAVQDTPFPDGNCLKCHANLMQTQDMSNHFHLFLTRWQALDASAGRCVSCHNGHNVNGDSSVKYLNKQDTTAVCQKCHSVLGGGG